jgi:glycerol-3-phosphate dehydrogenase
VNNAPKLVDVDQRNFDVAIIGSGINGAVSAAALAATGLSVILVDERDFAGFTSQESSNMVWGGIKYLQTLEFALVRSLCKSRARLFKNFPDQIREIGFFASLDKNAPAKPLFIYVGALIYWAIGGFSTQPPKYFSSQQAKKFEPNLASSSSPAVQYFDGILVDNDARFVWNFVKTAKSNGAIALNYTRASNIRRDSSGWVIDLHNALSTAAAHSGASIKAKVLINAGGPFVDQINQSAGNKTKSHIALSKGIHLIVPRITSDDRVLAFWDQEGRLFYVLPMGDRSVIGTTDTRVENPHTEVSNHDRDFVLAQINRLLDLPKPLTRNDIIAERSGVRPLVIRPNKTAAQAKEIDWHKLSREHVIETSIPNSAISILGGKLTDCLNVGEEIVDAVRELINVPDLPRSWFGSSAGRMPSELKNQAKKQFGPRAGEIAQAVWRRHGKSSSRIAAIWAEHPALAAEVFSGSAITLAELEHIVENEMVVSRNDVLRRRLPLALIRSESEIAENTELQALFAKHNL